MRGGVQTSHPCAGAGAQGLGELYAEEYVAAKTGGAAEDKAEGVRAEARALVAALTTKLDALSHFHFAPKPVVEDLAVRADVPALALEEVAPQARPLAMRACLRACFLVRIQQWRQP